MAKFVVLICGNRREALEELTPEQRNALKDAIERRIDALQYKYGFDLVVITGGATGVDTMVIEACEHLGIEHYTYRPDYDRHGRGAPLVRNGEMVDRADHVIAFWNGESRGTKNTLDHAHKSFVSHEVYYYLSRKKPKRHYLDEV